MLIPSVTESKANRGEAASSFSVRIKESLTHRDLLSRYGSGSKWNSRGSGGNAPQSPGGAGG